MTPDKLVETVARVILKARQERGLSGAADWEYEPLNIQELYLHNAKAAILTTLEGIREAPLDVFRAVLIETDETAEQARIGLDIIEGMPPVPPHRQRDGIDAATALVCDWHAMLDRLIADVKGE